MAPISARLVEELRALHPRQRAAVLHDGNVVVRAGPGSGKTRTLVARTGYVLATQVSSFRGAACITYTNAAATEIRHRLNELGVESANRLACSTLHSFCLNEILRSFSAITGEWLPTRGQVLGEDDTVALLQQCFDEIGIAETAAQWRAAHITKIRRAIACGEPIDVFETREVRAAQLYERRLLERNEIDFEAMVIRALRIVQDNAYVQDLLHARFPHVIVDEYQDLGGVLHRLILAVRDRAGSTVFAVGDADQTVFGFTGADPKYLDTLAHRPDFWEIDLGMNYRSGQNLIRAAEAVLGQHRGRRAVDDTVPGSVEIIRVEGSLDEHARETTRCIEASLDRGVAPERIAVLYPARGPLLDDLLRELAQSDLPFLHEREEQFPRGSLSQFIQGCASRAVLSAQVRRVAALTRQEQDIARRSEAPSLLRLERDLSRLRSEASLPEPRLRLTLLRSLQATLDPAQPYWPEERAGVWLEDLADRLELTTISAGHPDRENNRALSALLALCNEADFALQDLAAGVEVIGKVVVTTYHSAKGREFETVIMPGLVSGIVPRDVPEGRAWRHPNQAELQEQRRAFYVALTRAETQVYLIIGPGYHTPNGYWISRGPSDFVVEMLERLEG